jgi:hypothetical protein
VKTWIVTGRVRDEDRYKLAEMMLLGFWFDECWPERVVGGGGLTEFWCKTRGIDWAPAGRVHNPGMVIALEMHDAKIVDAAAQRGIPYVRLEEDGVESGQRALKGA